MSIVELAALAKENDWKNISEGEQREMRDRLEQFRQERKKTKNSSQRAVAYDVTHTLRGETGVHKRVRPSSSLIHSIC